MTTPARLVPQALGALPAGIERPAYRRDALVPGIVHLGLGAFARAHLAAATEDAVAATGDLRWGIAGVSLRHADVRDALAPQSGLYTLVLRDADAAGAARTRQRVIGCVLPRLLVAPEDPAAVVAAIADAATRIVSLTVTEKGHCHDPARRTLALDHPDIVHDLAHAQAPRSAIGAIVRGLAARRAAGRAPLTLLSLDNLPANGELLRGLVRAFADAAGDRATADWADARCTFPNSMVDRIVPRATDADRAAVAAALGVADAGCVVAEPFFDWAVEDRFAAGRPDWTSGGVRFVADAAPWERAKLRMVNGAHSTIAYLGVLAGWPTVDAAIAQPALARHLQALLRDEVEPTLADAAAAGLDRAAHRTRLLARFANPALAHRTAQIAMDGSQKLPQRLLAPLRERLAAGLPVRRLALGIAAWAVHLRGVDERGRRFAIDDPLAPALADLAARAEAAPDARARAAAITRFAPVFGDLADASALLDALEPAIESLRTRGVAATLAAMDGSDT